jgi:4-hydroxy-tetrahydrodipicolinate reductase
MKLRGCGTAIVTPFRPDGAIDEPALRALVAWQVESGIDFLVPCGTTGETPTLEREEWLQVVDVTIEVARERGHTVRAHDEFDNIKGSMLTPERLRDVDVVVDFTMPDAALENIEAVLQAGRNMVVGTTGWYQHMARIRRQVEKSGIGFLWAANFSIGVNLFFDIIRAAAPALKQGYQGHITEAHHVSKKDAPSGTAVKLQTIITEAGAPRLDITSLREGDVVGLHKLVLDSDADTITLTHNAKSRRGFAEGAVRAAEWLKGKKGFYDFKDVFREL